jgi:DNA-binding XRE family transcriptional regulator
MPARRTGLAAARKSAGHTQESLAAALHVDRSTVIRWEAGDYAPLPYLRPKLARLLRLTPETLRDLIDVEPLNVPANLSPEIEELCGWLDERLDWKPGTSARRVSSRLPRIRRELPSRRARRARVSRSDVVKALKSYYGTDPDYATYTASIAGLELETSVLTRPDWLDIRVPLTDETEHVTYVGTDNGPTHEIEPAAALERLAEAEAAGIRLANQPLYRLLRADIHPDGIHTTVGIAEFAEYALTLDLLENELLDAIADDRPTEPGTLPLRDRYLPTIATVVDLPARLCAGGIVALTAISRGTNSSGNDEADYALLVQERSNIVVNAPHQLTVIPKGFHQPITDHEADARLRTSLLREMEEELFGRADLDNTYGRIRAISPMHPRRMSEPMNWLDSEPGRLRLELAGVGLNLVSGNFEFACRAVIDAPDFWPTFAGHIEANWEAKALKTHTSRDSYTMSHLLARAEWNNEGLFALSSALTVAVEDGYNYCSSRTLNFNCEKSERQTRQPLDFATMLPVEQG